MIRWAAHFKALVRLVTKLIVHISSGFGKMWKCCSLQSFKSQNTP